MRRFDIPVLGQLRQPHGALAPMTARILNVVNQPINRLAVRALQLTGTEDVLDVGFGGGVGLALVLPRMTTGRVTGIDISDEMVRAAPQRFPDETAAGRLRVARADVTALPFPKSSFDRVYSVNSVFFWPDVRSGLSEIRRVLRPGGRLVIAAPASAFLLARIAGLTPPSGARTMTQTQRLAEEVGFADVRTRGRAGASLLIA
ncbi:MAG: methyltransferase domain-containing protein [Actinomycetota bacterium]